MDATAPTAEALEAAVRRIRRVARPEAPYGATRGTLGGEETALLVDTAGLHGWLGWSCTGSQHLFAPLDIVRHADGQEVVLPDVREPVTRACGQREAAGAGWRRGEAVTLLVSLLRGVSEAAVAGVADGEGEWWIAADGRPMFAFMTGTGETIVAASRVLVDRVAAQIDDRVLARAIDDVRTALDQPDALGRRLDELEEPLFDAAAPQPIQSEAPGPGGVTRGGRSILPDDADADGRFAWLRDAIDRHVDSSLGEMIRGAVGSIGERLTVRSERHARERQRRERGGARWPLVIAGAAAASLVVTLGMLWPADAPDARARSEPSARAPLSTDPAMMRSKEARPPERHKEAPTRSEDPVVAARGLLDEWEVCDDDCGLPDGLEYSGAVADPAREFALVDDYGAVALIEVSASEHRAQLLVIERIDERWRVRDLYAAPG